ncbi:hypothetical protein BCR33DRAFT_764513 [Rhizoclosmatium globosum]|uniref:Uncharacterized protein n=1 Tax=Rhizoclosmatium globosum TaxID=329046 RepID=A0A1Y2CIY1_9FUNG|nr:hypothetical protein BCR33DRAFT_764513 [Rhizoclosmatium globosum]|eukprot:ORY46794.1 hypothetical protein BCR33DRAFT_764513 [Rhizoclosmatium globosum]
MFVDVKQDERDSLGGPEPETAFQSEPKEIPIPRWEDERNASHMSFASLRKQVYEAVEHEKEAMANASSYGVPSKHSGGSRGSSMSSLGNKVHPIIQWLNRTQDNIMKSAWFKSTVGFLAADRTKILMWFFLFFVMHAAVTTVFIISLWAIMPGIWVYNFMQLFVISCSLVAYVASARLSDIVRTSIAAGDLLKGRITLFQMADYWVKGPRAPAQKVIRANIHNYVQGDIDFAEVYNYGLPLADGLVGGWPGWPMANPMDSFQINGKGPVYVLQVLCDNGIQRPDIDPGIYTLTSIRRLSQDTRGFMAQMQFIFPPNSTIDDISGEIQNLGMDISVSTSWQINGRWSQMDSTLQFKVQETNLVPHIRAASTNIQQTHMQVSKTLGAAAHFAIMQYSATAAPVDCDYFGYSGSGMLSIPTLAIYLSAAGSALACLMKVFEIMWWAMAQNAIEYESYRRARRALRHPLRFAIDAAEMLATGMAAGEREEDICDLTTTRAIEELGNARIMYGEDSTTRDLDVGHLRIAEYGKVKTIVKDKKYGTYRPSAHPEWDEFIGK